MKKQLIVVSSIFALGVATGCATENKKTAMGAGIGAAAGAAVGAVIGHQTGNRTGGALIGAAIGGGMGGVIGNRLDKQAKELEAVAETKRTEEGIVTKLKSDILFDTGKADLKAGATDNIAKLANIMKKYPENVLTIKGYTDSTGSKAINANLSARRADAVKQRLAQNGMPAETMTIVGMADANPVAPNTTADGRAQNRRVEIEITVDESKVPKK